MKILIIGNGFIGTPIIHKLESDGHELLIYSRTLKNGFGSKQVVGDISNFIDFAKSHSWKPDVIIHTAWITKHEIYTRHASNYVYAQFTSELAEYAVRTELGHLIILGTCAEYGSQSTPSVAGITKLNPSNLYAEQKVIAFNSVKKSLLGSNTRLTWARIFHPYGPRQDKKRLIPYLIDSLKSEQEVHLTDTASMLDWITTRDIAAAISWVIKNETPIEIDVGTAHGFTNVELLKTLEGLLGSSRQWTKYSHETSLAKQVTLVGEDSPLLKSGWIPKDNLITGLQWVLNS
jgi:nucleoside-diphosphate-sugar epimerase